jgi:hypothetical protein
MNKAEGSTKRGRVVCVDPTVLAFRGFVWKLSPVYADGIFDKSQRLERIIVEAVTICDGSIYACQGKAKKAFEGVGC